jgi:hypothetical protein
MFLADICGSFEGSYALKTKTQKKTNSGPVPCKKYSFFRNKSRFVLEKVTFLTLFCTGPESERKKEHFPKSVSII